MSARAGVDGRRDWTEQRVLATFPRLAERSSRMAAASSPAASSRCSRSAAR